MKRKLNELLDAYNEQYEVSILNNLIGKSNPDIETAFEGLPLTIKHKTELLESLHTKHLLEPNAEISEGFVKQANSRVPLSPLGDIIQAKIEEYKRNI